MTGPDCAVMRNLINIYTHTPRLMRSFRNKTCIIDSVIPLGRINAASGIEWLGWQARLRRSNTVCVIVCVTVCVIVCVTVCVIVCATVCVCVLIQYESLSNYALMYGHTCSKSMDQPGKVANPSCGQLNREKEYFPVPVRA